MSQKKTHDVIVHKAGLPLMTGESLGKFSGRLREAGMAYVNNSLSLVKDSSVYPVEIYGKSVVFDVAQYGKDVPSNKRYRFFAAAYTRKENGAFEFSTLTEVERVVTYQTKPPMAVTKAAARPVENAKTFEGAPDWKHVNKSLWANVL